MPVLDRKLSRSIIFLRKKIVKPKFNFDKFTFSTFIMTGAIKAGLPPFQLPPFGYDQNETLANSTIGNLEKKIEFFFLLLMTISFHS